VPALSAIPCQSTQQAAAAAVALAVVVAALAVVLLHVDVHQIAVGLQCQNVCFWNEQAAKKATVETVNTFELPQHDERWRTARLQQNTSCNSRAAYENAC
jgi:hypothetical protein